MNARFRIFESDQTSWEALLREAAAFASEIGPGRLIGLSHSEGIRSNGVVVVWYWEETPQAPASPIM
jgi:hypothetical protein